MAWGARDFIEDHLLKHPFIKTLGIREALEFRCLRYLSKAGLSGCRRFARDVHGLLDEASVAWTDEAAGGKPANTTVVFRGELVALAHDPRIYYFLKELNSEFAASATRPDAWAVAVRNAGSEAEALRWMAVLLQDTTPSATQLRFLEAEQARKPDPGVAFGAILEELRKALKTFIDADAAVENGAGGIDLREFYPSDAAAAPGLLNGSFYHYYVPGYLAELLAAKGYAPAEAAFGGYVFNYLYKIFTRNNAVTAAVAEPRAITDRDEAADIFLGLLGAQRGAGRAKAPPAPEQAFALIQASPRRMLQAVATDALP